MLRILAEGGFARAFASREFRIFWIGHFAHVLSVWIYRLAVAWLTWELTESTAWLGFMAAGNMLPSVFFGPLAGATADRWGHRTQLLVATTVGGIIALIVTVLVAIDRIQVELLLVLVTVSGIARSFNVPARGALIPSLVPRADISAATAVNGASFHGSGFLGPALFGLIIATTDITVALFTYTIGVVLTAVTLVMLKTRDAPPRSRGFSGLTSELADGFRYTARHPGIRLMMVMTAILSFFLHAYLDMLPAVTSRIFERGPEGLAQLTAAAGLGALIGGLWLAQRGRTGGLVAILLANVLAAALSLLAFVATTVFWVSLASLFVTGFAMVSAGIATLSLIQNSVDGALRARVLSMNAVLVIAGPALGAVGIGWAATYHGVRLPIAASACLALCVWLWAARAVWRERGALERD